METEILEEPKPHKKYGRPIKTEYDFFDPHKQKILKEKRAYSGQHLNRILRYRVVYNNQEYKFATLQQIQEEFNISYCLVNRLLLIFTKKLNNNLELTKYEQKIIDGYKQLTVFEKLPIDKSVKVIGFIKPTTDTSLSLKVDVPDH